MAIKKEGDLRVLKGATTYGPMTRADLERLLDRGKLSPTDQVSVLDGPWKAIGDYLARGLPPTVPAIDEAPRPSAGQVPKTGTLRLLKDNKVFSSLSRDRIAELRAKGRVGDDDLVCALRGPWMRLGDFFAAPAAAAQAMGLHADDEPVVAEIVEAVEVVAEQVGGEDDLEVLNVPGGHRIDDLLRPVSGLSDEWYVKVRGIHSAPLKKMHVNMLYQAREITLDCPARHATWRAEHWVPINAIAELAEVCAP